MINSFISNETNDLCKSLTENHVDWVTGNCAITNKKSLARIWIGNGLLYIDFYPNIGAFNIFEKIKIKKAIKICMVKNAISNKEVE